MLPFDRSDEPAGPPWPPPLPVRVVGVVLLALFGTFGTLRAAQNQPGSTPLDLLGLALVLAGPALLPLLGYRTRTALWLIATVTLAYLLLGYPLGPVVLSLVVAVVVGVVQGRRGTAWLVAGTVVATHVAWRTLVQGAPLSGNRALGMAVWAVVALGVAEVVRARRERALTAREARREALARQAGVERLRIAQELHDVVAHHMSLINVQAGVALHLADGHPEQVKPALEAIKAASKEALVEMRSLVGVLRNPADPAPRSPAATLRAIAEVVERSRHAGLDVELRTTGQERPLPAAVELAGFRIVQESITNVVRHASARRAVIHLDHGPETLTVSIEDDGRGLATTDRSAEGNGLRGMRERASALGGTLILGPSELGGLQVRAALPITPPGATTDREDLR